MADLDWTLITSLVTMTGVFVGVIFGLRQINDIVKSRHTNLFVDLYDHLNSQEFQKMYNQIIYVYKWDSYDDWLEKYGPDTNIEAWSSFVSVGSFFDGIGVLVSRKLIDLELVDDLMSSSIIWLWEKMEPVVLERRKRRNRPQLWEFVEYLYKEVKKREQKTTQTKI
jgi:hypothetical protein